MVHRVDGPIGVYRGFDDGTDRHIVELNRELADATVFQSRYSLDKHRELGLELREPRRHPERARPGGLQRRGTRRAARRRARRGWSRRAGPTTRARAPTCIAELERGLDPAPLLADVRRPLVRRRSSAPASIPPVPSTRGRPAAPRASRLRLREPQRGLLELAARGARLRPPGPLRRQRLEPPRSSATAGWRSSDADDAAARARRARRRAGQSCRPPSACPSLAETADRYLEVLRP